MEHPSRQKVRAGLRRLWQQWIRPLLVAAAIVLPLRSSIADWYNVPTGSMKPTIVEGDRIFVNKLAYDLRIPFTSQRLARWRDPARGDVVVLRSPADGVRLVKRVVGLPGDVISMQDNRLRVNGEPVEYDPLVTEGGEAFRSQGYDLPARVERLPGRDHAVLWDPSQPSQRTFPPLRVPEGNYLVMGDNRDNSADSRYFGFVSRDRIYGRAETVVFSLNRDHLYLPRWERFLRGL